MPATVASFSVEYHQFLDRDGHLIGDDTPELAKDFEKLISIYKLMVQTRTFDYKAIALQRTGKLGTYASCLGHEAAQIGIGSAMRAEDCFAPMYRDYGTQLYRGVTMTEILLYWGGDERGNDYSGPRHDFAWCVPIATQCLHAAGAAMTFKLRNEKRVAVTVVGDGGSSKGDVLEAINAASAYDLPLVIVIMNNQWAISVPRSKQNSAKTLAQKGLGAGLHSAQVDGNDYIASHLVMEEAVERARNGEGASVIEMITYRLTDHTTADDASRYREDSEVKEAWKSEPVARLRKYLENEGHWDDKKQLELEKQVAEMIDVSVKEYLNTPSPGIASMFDYMYAELPHDLQAQKEFALKEADNA